MAQYVAKQPNGRYCIFSTVSSCPTAWNLTADDYINLCVETAKEKARGDLVVADAHDDKFHQYCLDYEPDCMPEVTFHQFLEEVSKKVEGDD